MSPVFGRIGIAAAAIAALAAACEGCPGEEAAADFDAAPPDAVPGEAHFQIGAHEIEPDTGDWEAIRERGALRVLVPSTEEAYLPRRGMPGALDRRLVRILAGRHDLEVQFILVPEHDQLLPLLREGMGDLAAAQLTVTESRAEDVAFTWPLRTVEEVVVGRADDDDLPEAEADLDGREVHVRADSAYAETLRELQGEVAPDLEIVDVPERVDTEHIAYEVSRGERPLTVVDSHILSAIEAYNEDLERLFSIAEGREIAWAVRPENEELKSVLDSYLIESALVGEDREDTFVGDLDGIRDRGVLRVLTRNNPVTYFLHRGERHGFEYNLARTLAEELDVRLEMVVPPSRDALIPWLLEGEGDLIAASLTVTPERAEEVTFSEPYLHVDEILVGPRSPPEGEAELAEIDDVADLEGRSVHVRRSASYYDTLREIAEEVDFEIVTVPEELETREILAMVAAGEVPLTVADTHILQVERAYDVDVRPLASLTGAAGSGDPMPARVGFEGESDIAFAMRPDAEALAEYVDAFASSLEDREAYHVAIRRYFERRRAPTGGPMHRPEDGEISAYDDLIRDYSERYGIDWRLMAALAWRESRFDPNARSWVGAIGMFQVMPRTGRALGFHNLHDPGQSAHAGIMYFHRLLSRLDPRIPPEERPLFALAGYNAGLGHVADARRLADRKGWDSTRWFDNVERAMLLLQNPEYHRRARHGYVRGREPVTHVREIHEQYRTYAQLAPP